MSTKNELFFAELLSPTAAKWSAGVAFDRSNGLPLDQWSVFQSEAEATAYLSNSKAYPGQVIAYAEENGEMTACVLSQNEDGSALTLKPIGIIPAGDNKTIDVSAAGVITLKGAAAATAGQQPRIVNKGTAEAPQLELEWYTPDNSTVAGLQDTVGGLVETINGVEGDATKPGLVAEVNALKLADIELAADIKEIADDYVKSADIAEFETKAKVKEVADALANYKTSNDTALAGVRATANAAAVKSDVDAALANKADKSVVDAMYTNTKIDELVAGAKTYTDTEVAKKADKSAYDQTVLDLTALTNKVNAFLDGTGADTDAIDTLQELLEYIDAHDAVELAADIEALEKKVVLGTYEVEVEGETQVKEYDTVKAYVEAAINALAIGDYAKAADLTTLAGRVATLEAVDNFTQSEFAEFNTANSTAIEKAKTDAIADADGKLANKLDKSAFETFKGENTTAIATAKSEAIADADGKLANKLDKSAFETFKTENTAAIGTAKSEAIAAAATDATTKADKALADAKADTAEQLKSYKTSALTTEEIKAAVAAEATRAEAVEKKNAQDIVNLGTRIDGVSTRAEKGITDAQAAASAAATAQTTADGAAAQASTNASEIGKHASRLSTLETFKTAHETEFSGLNDRVGAAETAITGLTNNKAEKSVVNGIDARVAQIELDLNGKPAEEGSEKVVGLKERVETNAANIVELDSRVDDLEADVAALEAKEDADTTYTFENGTDGTFIVTPKNGSAQTIDTGAKAYTDAEIKKVTDVMATDDEVKGVKEALETKISVAEGEIDTLQETIKGLSGAMHFKGVVTVDPTSEDFVTTDYVIGDVVIFGNKEYVFAEVDVVVGDETVKGNRFVEFGDASGNASAISALDKRVTNLEEVDHAAAHEATLNSAKGYADSLAGNYATAAQGAKADTAAQAVTCKPGMGITATRDENNNVVIDWDTNVTLILCGGGAN